MNEYMKVAKELADSNILIKMIRKYTNISFLFCKLTSIYV